jgi:hypothetical protein
LAAAGNSGHPSSGQERVAAVASQDPIDIKKLKNIITRNSNFLEQRR